MESGFRIGRIAGIPVSVNWSLVIVFWLLSWSLASSVLPVQVPGLEAGAYWLAAILVSVFFFASLLAHELAHSIVARMRGIPVHGITLWLFGGVARIGGEAATPSTEILFAVVGPLTSLVLGAAFVLAAVASGLLSGSELFTAAVSYLGWANLALAVFNSVPAFPLDGGRVLRAVLWAVRGDPVSATTWAARVGRGFGVLLIIVGGFELFIFGSLVNGLWLGFLGWFLISAAQAEEGGLHLRRALRGIRVGDVMTRQPVAAQDEMSVQELLDRLVFATRYVTFPVKDAGGHLRGLVTLTAVKALRPERRATTRVADIMCPLAEVAVARPQDLLLDLVGRMDGCAEGRALVVEGDSLVGIVSPSDVNRVIRRAGFASA